MKFDYSSGRILYISADKIVDYIKEINLDLFWIMGTHFNVDHLSAAAYIKETLGGKTGIGKQVVKAQETFGKVFNEGNEFIRDASQFDYLFVDGYEIMVGSMTTHVLHTPGHDPAII